MFWLKRCPQCRGDLIAESDVHGSYVVCLQCGRTLTNQEEQTLRAERTSAPERPLRRRTGAA